MNALLRRHTKQIRFAVTLENLLKCNKYGDEAVYLNKRRYLTMNTALRRYNHNINLPRQLSIAYYDNRPRVLLPFGSYDNMHMVRHIHKTRLRFEHKPSSKLEVTVQSMKNKQKEKVEGIMKEAASKEAAAESGLSTGISEAPKPQAVVPVKKSLKTRIWEEIVHYYHGFRLLAVDVGICRKLLWRVLNGKTLTRRENKLLLRTTGDIFRLIPFSVFIIVPFMELLLPVFIKLFPGMLPSTFQTAKEREDKLKQSLQVKLQMAKFLQKTLDEMTVENKDNTSSEAKDFSDFFRRIRDPNENVTSEEIIKYAKRFESEITLDSLSPDQLSALCRLLELNTMGTSNLLRFQLRVKLRSLAADDRVIAREGVESLNLIELQQACKSRGMRAYGMTSANLRSQLQEWIDLSLNVKVPPILLLLSRAMLVSEETTTTDKLMQTIRVLPESLEAQTKVAIGEREGKTDFKTKIEVIKDEVRKIQEEHEEERQEQAARAEILVDKAPTISDGRTDLNTMKVKAQPKSKDVKESDKEIKEEELNSKDVNLLSEALKTLSQENKKMLVEKETIRDLKEELAEYKEDADELREVRKVVKQPVHESKAAKALFRKVNSMIGNLDKIVADLEKKNQTQLQKQVKEEAEEDVEGEAKSTSKENSDNVHIVDLILALRKLQKTSNESRMKQIENILSKIDADKDGVITVEEVLKVVEALGRENVKLNDKQIEDVVTLLDKEQLIEEEEKIEKAIAKSMKEVENIRVKKQAEQQQHANDEAMAAAKMTEDSKDLLEDKAPEIKDMAKDLSSDDNKHILVDKEMRISSTTTVSDGTCSKPKILNTAKPSKIPTNIPPPATSLNSKDKMI